MDDSAQHKRREQRVDLARPLSVYNNQTQEVIGQLNNLSLNGFLLTSPTPIPEGMIIQCRVEIENSKHQECSLSLGAESLWQRESPCGHQYWCGFQILDISPQDTQLIQELISEQGDQ